MNRLYYGDCLTIMQDMALGSVDLIYLDPPFNSQRDYNAIYKTETGQPLPDQIEAFCDTWTLDDETERAARTMPVLMREAGVDDQVAEFWKHWMNALRHTNPRVLAYLIYMTQRLLPMRGILKKTGSIYLHCDPTASHYIKVMMDGIFGHENFRNEITWRRTNAHPLGRRKYEAITDTIFFYTRGDLYTFNGDTVPMSDTQIDELYDKKDDSGRFTSTDLTGGKAGGPDAYRPFNGKLPPAGRAWAPPATGRLPSWARHKIGPSYNTMNQLERCHALDEVGLIYWTRNGTPRLKRYLGDQGEKPTQSVPNLWLDIKPASAEERLGYDTQKPRLLLERIIRASSNPGDVVLDPFCGCATTIEAAHRLDRRWIGIDIAIHAIKRVAKARLQERLRLVEGTDFVIEGVPRNLEGARDLWQRDKYHFQKWAVEQVDGFVTARRTGDGGIDGRLYFPSPDYTGLASMVIEVKGGASVGIGVVRDLRGVLARDSASMAGLIIMDELGERKKRNFVQEMAMAGDVTVHNIQYPRMQMLTVSEILDGVRFKTPGAVGRGSGGALGSGNTQGVLPI